MATGAYARVRSQFKTPIGKFRRDQEPLARIGGYALFDGRLPHRDGWRAGTWAKPSVLSAISKYHMTERMRIIVNDAMDVITAARAFAWARTILGPRLSAAWYRRNPVEGANILTRSLIIFGRGAIRCHPWVLKEMKAARDDSPESLRRRVLGPHQFTVANAARLMWMGITGGRGLAAPACVETSAINSSRVSPPHLRCWPIPPCLSSARP